MYKSALSTRVEEDGGKEGGGSKARHAYRAIDMNNLPSEVLTSHVNYFWEPLYCAERCWAASMAVKAEGGSSSGGGGGMLGGGGGDPKKDWSPGKIRAHAIKRLRKAAKFATLLETLTMSTKSAPSADEENKEEGDATAAASVEAKPPVDEHTQTEARAYASWMRGNLALEQNQWQTACNEYQTALTLCESLANDSSGNGKGDEDGNNNADLQQLELFDFFTTRAQNVIAPLLRYCHYELQVSASCIYVCCFAFLGFIRLS